MRVFMPVPAPLRALSLALLIASALLFQAGGAVIAQDHDRVTIVTEDARHVFTVELANTPATRAQGLMYRRSMPEDHGMLFDFGRVEMVTMWMRNTYTLTPPKPESSGVL